LPRLVKTEADFLLLSLLQTAFPFDPVVRLPVICSVTDPEDKVLDSSNAIRVTFAWRRWKEKRSWGNGFMG
jgi:hypothetical protein